MIKFEEIWSTVKKNTAIAIFDNAYNDTNQTGLVTIPKHREYQRDSNHPKWYGTEKSFLQVAKDRFMVNEGLPPHQHVFRKGYAQQMIDENYPPMHIDEFIYVVEGTLLVKIYDIDDSFMIEKTLNKNDFFIYWDGGAAIKALCDNTRIFVIKPGPYEGPEMDKRDFKDKELVLTNHRD